MIDSQFVRGNDRLERMLEDEDTARAVAALSARADELDRIHAQTLAMIRETSQLTQTEIARKLSISQGAVSQLEKRNDMLLSTLRNYIRAAGAENLRILVTINGEEVEVQI